MSHLTSEPVIRLAISTSVFLLLAAAEAVAPRRRHLVDVPRRWFHNLALVFLNTVVVRVLFPMGAVGVALLAEERRWGLFNNAAVPPWLAVLLTVVALDFVIYLQHVLFHAVPVLWRLHMVHHADLDIDVTTGLRFHTLEILLSLGIKAAAVVLLGAPALGVLAFEVLLNATAMFNHSNIRLPGWLDSVLRLVVVTPDMHRVHHSADGRENNRNFGFNLPWWDYLLGTYLGQPAEGHERMTVGLPQPRDEHQVDRLPGMLLLPFCRKKEGDAPLTRVRRAAPSPLRVPCPSPAPRSATVPDSSHEGD